MYRSVVHSVAIGGLALQMDGPKDWPLLWYIGVK